MKEERRGRRVGRSTSSVMSVHKPYHRVTAVVNVRFIPITRVLLPPLLPSPHFFPPIRRSPPLPSVRPPPPCATLPFVLLLSISVDHLDPVPLLILPLPPRSPTVDFAQWLRSLLHLQRRPHTTVQATRLQLVYKVIVVEPHLVRCSSVRCSSGQVLSG